MKILARLLCVALLVGCAGKTPEGSFVQDATGVVVTPATGDAKRVRVQVRSNRVVRVTAVADDKLELPASDRHIIVTVHYYEPHEFTHQGASWGDPEWRKLSGVRWGSPADLAKLGERFDAAQAWARKHDRPILLGEFGAYDKAPQEDRIKYTAAVARAAEKRGWAFGYWQFDSNFIVYDIDRGAWNTPIYRALVPLD